MVTFIPAPPLEVLRARQRPIEATLPVPSIESLRAQPTPCLLVVPGLGVCMEMGEHVAHIPVERRRDR